MIVIPVFSDTHGFGGSIEKCAKVAKMHETFFHLGDNLRDAVVIEKMSGKKGYKVVGNTDIGVKGEESILLTIGQKRILLTHGHKFGVKSDIDRISYYSEENSIDIAVFGHTHAPLEAKINQITYFNPGSAALPRGRYGASYGLIKIENGTISTEIIEF